MARKKPVAEPTPKRFGLNDITPLHVLGMLLRINQLSRENVIGPCLLCMSEEARAEVIALGQKAVSDYLGIETHLRVMRETGNNPRAFFIDPIIFDLTKAKGGT